MAPIASPTPGLLVSVRSAEEAIEAVLGGASVVDVKEPGRGPLGCADPEVWRLVREAVPSSVPVSVALGELREWLGRPVPSPGWFSGVAYRKLGLSGMAGTDWIRSWGEARDAFGPGPAWVAVAYLDADRAGAPSPDEVRDVAASTPGCAGLLLDTWDKSRSAADRMPPAGWFEPIRRAGRFVALAGGLGAGAIARLAPMRPELFAVRGAACIAGDRGGRVDRGRVRALLEAVEAARVQEGGAGAVGCSGGPACRS